MTVRRRHDALFRVTPTHLLLADATGTIHQWTGSASLLWALLELEWELDELVAVVAEETGADRGEVAAGVQDFVERLRDGGFLVES